MEHPNRANYVRLAELKTVVSFLLSCEGPVSAYLIYQNTGVSAANLAWIMQKLSVLGLVAVSEDTLIHTQPDKRALFTLGRNLRLAKIKHLLDRVPDSKVVRPVSKELDVLPKEWRLLQGDGD